MLLANSFNGKRILPIKLAFIERFDELEHITLEQAKETENRKNLNQAIKFTFLKIVSKNHLFIALTFQGDYISIQSIFGLN